MNKENLFIIAQNKRYKQQKLSIRFASIYEMKSENRLFQTSFHILSYILNFQYKLILRQKWVLYVFCCIFVSKYFKSGWVQNTLDK